METLTMSNVERRRLEVVSQVRLKKLTLQKGSELLGIGYRQMKRLWSRYQAEGDADLVHRLRGSKSNRRGDARLRKRASVLRRSRAGLWHAADRAPPAASASPIAWQAHQVDSRTEAGEDSSVAWPWPTFLPDSR